MANIKLEKDQVVDLKSLMLILGLEYNNPEDRANVLGFGLQLLSELKKALDGGKNFGEKTKVGKIKPLDSGLKKSDLEMFNRTTSNSPAFVDMAILIAFQIVTVIGRKSVLIILDEKSKSFETLRLENFSILAILFGKKN